jgi:hypothetical protein
MTKGFVLSGEQFSVSIGLAGKLTIGRLDKSAVPHVE